MTMDSLTFSRYLCIQIKECEEHRYYMAESANRDIDDNTSMMDWCSKRYSAIEGKTHAERYSDDFARNAERIHKCCDALCGERKCEGKVTCPLCLKTIHRLLQD